MGNQLTMEERYPREDCAGSLYWNPAGLSGMERVQAKFSHMFYLEGINYNFLLFAKPVGSIGTVSLGATSLYTGGIERTLEEDMNYEVGLEKSIHNILILRAGYGTRADTGDLTGLQAGIGINWKNIEFDYGFVPYGQIGNTHQVTLGIFF